MLNLPNVTETKLVTNEEDYLIHAESVVSIRDCPHCRSANSVVIGSRKQKYVDTQCTQRKYDIDNFCKAVFDALTHCEFWADDEQVDRLTVLKGEKVPGGKLSISVTIL